MTSTRPSARSAKAIGKAAKAAPDVTEAFARRAIEADMRYMHETRVLDDDGLMGEGEYDEDDAFEALFAEMTDGLEDDGEIGRIAQMLDAYMEARQDFMEENGLADDWTGGHGRWWRKFARSR